jgi:hypothetical protein
MSDAVHTWPRRGTAVLPSHLRTSQNVLTGRISSPQRVFIEGPEGVTAELPPWH